MFQKIIFNLIGFILRLRYRIILKNFPMSNSNKSVLILPNHPALIDPLILLSVLHKKFQPRALADEKRLDIPGLRKLIKSFRPIPIPDPDNLAGKKDDILLAVEKVAEALRAEDNVLLYPAGRIYRSRREDLRANSSVEFILKNVPDIEILLVSIQGLWGSSFGWASGEPPQIFQNWLKFLSCFIFNGLFFIPRREITIEFKKLQLSNIKGLDRHNLNRKLEEFYNQTEEFNTYVPYFWWQGKTPQVLPEPVVTQTKIDLSDISPKIISSIKEKITELTGTKNPQLTDRLSLELGMDSLAVAELMGWIGDEYHQRVENLEGISTLSDAILIASGQSLKKETTKKIIAKEWFSCTPRKGLYVPKVKTITEAFLEHSYSQPNRALIIDEMAGLKTSRQIRLGVSLLSKKIAKLEGKRIGILLPASVATTTVYLATLFANKVPTMVNWTVGSGVLKSSLENVEVKTILTSKKMLERLKTTGIDLENLPFNWIYLEELAHQITLPQKLLGLISSYLPWRTLKAPTNDDPAVILFTSGSEAKPKAVPLSHANLLQNVDDSLTNAYIPANEKMLGMLPPFHSMGLMTGVLLPLCTNVQVVYHANPTESVILADVIERYKASLLLGTPTFINGILRVADKDQLRSIRLIVTGAEKCPDYVYQKLHEYCPSAIIAEGYGITECSPVVSLNDPRSPVWGSLGKVFPSLEYCLVHPENMTPIAPADIGLLLVRGPSVFSGYINHQGNSPFIKYEGKQWYNTGDLVKRGPQGVLIFAGRLKRFVKMAGEMISLVAVEEVISSHYPPLDEGPRVAVEAANPDTQPELVLFTVIPLEREEVNNLIRQSGLSGLHNIRRIEQIASIPILGTGKTDYKSLKEILTA